MQWVCHVVWLLCAREGSELWALGNNSLSRKHFIAFKAVPVFHSSIPFQYSIPVFHSSIPFQWSGLLIHDSPELCGVPEHLFLKYFLFVFWEQFVPPNLITSLVSVVHLLIHTHTQTCTNTQTPIRTPTRTNISTKTRTGTPPPPIHTHTHTLGMLLSV